VTPPFRVSLRSLLPSARITYTLYPRVKAIRLPSGAQASLRPSDYQPPLLGHPQGQRPSRECTLASHKGDGPGA
jgi:hypothetical protein